MMRSYVFFVSVAITLSSCLKDKTVQPLPPPADACVDTVYFNDELLVPLFNTSCNTSGCHSAEDAAAGRIWIAHDSIANHATEILKSISHSPDIAPMPLGGPKIADSLIQKFDCWMQQGKLNN